MRSPSRTPVATRNANHAHIPCWLAGLALVGGCALQTEPTSESASSHATETCSSERAIQLEDAMWNGYAVLAQHGCVAAPETESCKTARTQFDEAALAFFACLGAQQFQPLCESLERAHTRWDTEQKAYCQPAAEADRAYCEGIAYFAEWAEATIPTTCTAWPTSGPCSADERAKRLTSEQALVGTMLASECLPYDAPSDACSAARSDWASVKEGNATCNAARNGETLCSYYERKQAKAESGLASACTPADDADTAPPPFDTWESYCGYLTLHRDHYASAHQACE